MATIPETIAVAVEHHQAGQWRAAEQLYRQVLAAEPHQADAWNLLGVLNVQLGRHDDGEECVRRALALRPDWAEAFYNLGWALREQEKLDEAAVCLRRAIELAPDYVQAHDTLGVVLQQQGKLSQAVACHRRALELNPLAAAAHNNLGMALAAEGDIGEAAACYRRALELKPNFALAHNNLGLVLQEQGILGEAAACHRRALEQNPRDAAAHNNLGMALAAQGNLDEAAACYRRALDLKPDAAESHSNLGIALRKQGKLDEAVACIRRALELKPDFALAYCSLGDALNEQGKLDEAVACYHRALALDPDLPEAHHSFGIALDEQGKLEEAIACYRRALELKPDFAEAHCNLGAAWKEQGKLEEAVASYRRALDLKPDFPEAHNNLGIAWKDQGKLDEAVASFRRAVELKRDYAAAHSNLLLTLQYRAGVTQSELAAAHREYDRLRAEPLRAAWRPHENLRDRAPSAGGSRPLRVGFVSPDFGRHPVGYFLIRVLENLDRSQCEPVCYCTRVAQDDMAARFHAVAALWRDVVSLNNDQLAERIRADRIDVLFDVAGHTAGNRLLAFARKPAPIQITWLGYEGTTGLTAMDYILADRHTIPPGSESFYCERVLRMPDGYACYDPPTDAPEPGPLPAIRNGRVRFGSFNNLAKITPRVVEVWSRVLQRVPQSRLALKYRGLGDRSIRDRYRGMFTDLGLDPARLELSPPSDYTEYLAAHREVDVALDTFPFGGGVTTCNALWMGLPVVTCPGDTFAGRHCLSHLANVGLTETIARDLDEYVELAVALAGDLPRLAALRATLRERTAVSPLCDGKRFAANLMGVLRDAWRKWCEGIG